MEVTLLSEGLTPGPYACATLSYPHYIPLTTGSALIFWLVIVQNNIWIANAQLVYAGLAQTRLCDQNESVK